MFRFIWFDRLCVIDGFLKKIASGFVNETISPSSIVWGSGCPMVSGRNRLARPPRVRRVPIMMMGRTRLLLPYIRTKYCKCMYIDLVFFSIIIYHMVDDRNDNGSDHANHGAKTHSETPDHSWIQFRCSQRQNNKCRWYSHFANAIQHQHNRWIMLHQKRSQTSHSTDYHRWTQNPSSTNIVQSRPQKNIRWKFHSSCQEKVPDLITS